MKSSIAILRRAAAHPAAQGCKFVLILNCLCIFADFMSAHGAMS